MDTHWNKKFKALGPVADRVARGFFIAALLVLTLGPLPFTQTGDTPAAQAGTLSWTGIRPPLYAGIDSDDEPFTALGPYQAAAGDNNVVALAPDGTVFAGSAGNTSVYYSNDGGMSWTAAATGCGTGVLDIKVSRKYSTDNSVLALCVTAATAFSLSLNGGVSWTAGPASLSNAPTVFDVAPNFSGVDGGMVCFGSTAGTVTDIVQCSRWSGTAWSAAFVINNTLGPRDATNATSPDAGDGVVGLAFSPKFSTDGQLIVILFEDDTGDYEEFRVSIGNTTATTGNISPAPTNFTAVLGGAGRIAAAAGAATANVRIAFPADSETGGTVYFMCVNNNNDGVVADVEDLYKRTGTTTTGTYSAQTPASSGTAAISCSDVAVSGNLDSASVYVIDDTASPGVVRSTNGGTSWKPEETVDEDGGAIGGPEVNRLAISSSHATDNLVYAAASGTRGGIAKSSNRASGWADTGLTNDDFNNAYTSLNTDGTTAFVIACDVAVGANAACTGNESIFRTTSVAEGSSWNRVDRRAGTTLVQMSPSYKTDGTVYAIVGSVTSSQVLKSTDGGQLFKVSTSDPGEKAITALRVVSASRVYVGNAEGYVQYTTDGGATWTQSATDTGRNVLDIEVSPNFATDNTLLLGGIDNATNYAVWLSTDGGATWTQQGPTTAWGAGTGGNSMDVAFSPYFGTPATTSGAARLSADVTDPWIFAAPSGAATDGPRRCKVGSCTSWTSMSVTNGISGSDTSIIGLVAATGVGDGILFYGLEGDVAGGDIGRTYYPTTVSSTNSSLRYLNSDDDSDNGAGLIFQRGTLNVIGGTTNTLYVLDNAGTQTAIRTFAESSAFLTPPTLSAPLDNGTVASCQGQNAQIITLQWATKDRARDWDVQVAADSAFDTLLIDTTGTPGIGTNNPIYTIGPGGITACIVTDGSSYWWRTRVQDVGLSGAGTQHEGPWSTARKFSVGTLGSPTSPGPSLPLDGAQLPGLSTQLSWNNPSGTTQTHVQVTPLNNDGPAIDLLFGSALTTYDVPAPVFGTGPYVVLPGASYTWRVRTSNASTAIGVTDPSWGPWSTPRTFSTAPPNAGTIQLLGPINGESITDTTPTVQWKDANAAMFYYEVQLSADPNFGAAGAVAAVYWNLIHAGQSNPPGSWTVPDSAALAKGTYSWRVRQRLQATAKGSLETGIAWTPSQSFVVK